MAERNILSSGDKNRVPCGILVQLGSRDSIHRIALPSIQPSFPTHNRLRVANDRYKFSVYSPAVSFGMGQFSRNLMVIAFLETDILRSI